MRPSPGLCHHRHHNMITHHHSIGCTTCAADSCTQNPFRPIGGGWRPPRAAQRPLHHFSAIFFPRGGKPNVPIQRKFGESWYSLLHPYSHPKYQLTCTPTCPFPDLPPYLGANFAPLLTLVSLHPAFQSFAPTCCHLVSLDRGPR